MIVYILFAACCGLASADGYGTVFTPGTPPPPPCQNPEPEYDPFTACTTYFDRFTGDLCREECRTTTTRRPTTTTRRITTTRRPICQVRDSDWDARRRCTIFTDRYTGVYCDEECLTPPPTTTTRRPTTTTPRRPRRCEVKDTGTWDPSTRCTIIRDRYTGVECDRDCLPPPTTTTPPPRTPCLEKIKKWDALTNCYEHVDRYTGRVCDLECITTTPRTIITTEPYVPIPYRNRKLRSRRKMKKLRITLKKNDLNLQFRSNCSDNVAHCRAWSKRRPDGSNFCDTNKYVKKKCPKACGVCTNNRMEWSARRALARRRHRKRNA